MIPFVSWWLEDDVTVAAGQVVTITATRNVGYNSVISGIFLGDGEITSQVDDFDGNWVGGYGSDGFVLAGYDPSGSVEVLEPADFGLIEGRLFTWEAPTGDGRALQHPYSSRREASTWFGEAVVGELYFSESYTGPLSVYGVDWDSTARRQTVSFSGPGVDYSQTVDSLSGGSWVTHNITVQAGDVVTIRADRIAGSNAVISGVFLGGEGAPPVDTPSDDDLAFDAAVRQQVGAIIDFEFRNDIIAGYSPGVSQACTDFSGDYIAGFTIWYQDGTCDGYAEYCENWACASRPYIVDIAAFTLTVLPGYDCYDIYASGPGVSNVAFCAAEFIPGAGKADEAVQVVRKADEVFAVRRADNLVPTSSIDDVAQALCSFGGATPVLLADDTTKLISEIEVGDWVFAENPETGERGQRQVTHLWVHQDELIQLEIDGHKVATTQDHPFWNDTDNLWQRADQLDEGDQVRTADGDLISVGGIDWTSAHTSTAYNLTVEGIHTYFVAIGSEEVLVHNTCPWNLDSLFASGQRVTTASGLTRAGQKLQQHGGQGNLPVISGNVEKLNASAAELLEDILTDPRTRVEVNQSGNFAGGRTFIDPIGRGARYDADGVFQFFGAY